jgi:hypothetical protein
MRVVSMLLLLAALALLDASIARAGSDVPPKGPPWQQDFVAAHKEAVASGKPIFLYFTKTY